MCCVALRCVATAGEQVHPELRSEAGGVRVGPRQTAPLRRDRPADPTSRALLTSSRTNRSDAMRPVRDRSLPVHSGHDFVNSGHNLDRMPVRQALSHRPRLRHQSGCRDRLCRIASHYQSLRVRLHTTTNYYSYYQCLMITAIVCFHTTTTPNYYCYYYCHCLMVTIITCSVRITDHGSR